MNFVRIYPTITNTYSDNFESRMFLFEMVKIIHLDIP